MHDAQRVPRNRTRILWLVGLGACALWLVVQNTLLLLALLWAEPAAARAVGTALVKAGSLVAAKLWALPILSAAAGGFLAVVRRERDATPSPGEVRHV